VQSRKQEKIQWTNKAKKKKDNENREINSTSGGVIVGDIKEVGGSVRAPRAEENFIRLGAIQNI
jgi:hypothetical protein